VRSSFYQGTTNGFFGFDFETMSVLRDHPRWSARFANVAPFSATGNAVDTPSHVVRISVRCSFYQGTTNGLFGFERCPNVALFSGASEFLSHASDGGVTAVPKRVP
jgi:hypothetical protein